MKKVRIIILLALVLSTLSACYSTDEKGVTVAKGLFANNNSSLTITNS